MKLSDPILLVKFRLLNLSINKEIGVLFSTFSSPYYSPAFQVHYIKFFRKNQIYFLTVE